MKTVFLSSAYLAPIEYYTKLLAYDKVFIEQHDHYMESANSPSGAAMVQRLR